MASGRGLDGTGTIYLRKTGRTVRLDRSFLSAPAPPHAHTHTHKHSKKKKKIDECTCNSGYSLVVTDPTTDPPHCSLCMADRTGCPVLYKVWSHVVDKQGI